jgi:CRISPR-associated protein Cas1
VLRGIVARAVCASGFHPAIGLHHHNQYNAYCLADDLMEPFRPLVDRIVRSQAEKPNLSETLTSEAKTELIAPLLGRFSLNNELQTLFECATHIVTSLVQFFGKERKELSIPDSFEVIEEEKPF